MGGMVKGGAIIVIRYLLFVYSLSGGLRRLCAN